ncbi:hypothetical protein BB559_002646 [Furculomyces boomerangus]|uniref:YCII-related domain-containing protein n=1 Tax=Furculomyces boomerangus TaxID=61424 RepID=A0A2T9YTJ3_9FUNG|nr:hypothetical protein BB559_002646 [Furculomyces boomerangus]
MIQQNPKYFYFIIHESTDPIHVARKPSVVDEHVAYLKTIKAESYLQSAAVIKNKDGDYIGAILLCRADSEHHAKSLIENDPFVKDGIWDINTLKVHEVLIMHI